MQNWFSGGDTAFLRVLPGHGFTAKHNESSNEVTYFQTGEELDSAE